MKIMILATAVLVATTLGALADEFPEYQVRVNEFSPGFVGTRVTATIANEVESGGGEGISEVASSEAGRPEFAPEEGKLDAGDAQEPGDGSFN
jgi:NAD(P)-dependent dehydrogenase (short-subunit alcohol dehydrogenase family)